jgi:hypothetical protein
MIPYRKEAWQTPLAVFLEPEPDYYEQRIAVKEGLGGLWPPANYPAKGDYSQMAPGQARAFKKLEKKLHWARDAEYRAIREIREELLKLYPEYHWEIEYARIDPFNQKGHRLLVERAWQLGLPVPIEVLEDYPELLR